MVDLKQDKPFSQEIVEAYVSELRKEFGGKDQKDFLYVKLKLSSMANNLHYTIRNPTREQEDKFRFAYKNNAPIWLVISVHNTVPFEFKEILENKSLGIV